MEKYHMTQNEQIRFCAFRFVLALLFTFFFVFPPVFCPLSTACQQLLLRIEDSLLCELTPIISYSSMTTEGVPVMVGKLNSYCQEDLLAIFGNRLSRLIRGAERGFMESAAFRSGTILQCKHNSSPKYFCMTPAHRKLPHARTHTLTF